MVEYDNSAPIRHHRDLRVWQEAMRLVEEVYRVTDLLPDGERFVLVAQMRRAAISVPSNIAEGYGRDGRRDYRRHVRIATGSLCELETQLVIAGRLGYVTREQAADAWTLIQNLGKMLHALARKLGQSPPSPRSPSPEARTPHG